MNLTDFSKFKNSLKLMINEKKNENTFSRLQFKYFSY